MNVSVVRFTDFAAKFSLLPSDEERVSKLVSEPGAVATGPNNSAKLDDPVAIALGSDTDFVAKFSLLLNDESLDYLSTIVRYADDARSAVIVQSLSYIKFETMRMVRK